MSQEALSQFAQKVNSDADLREALQERFDDLSSIPADDLISFAEERGYSFTVEEAKNELTDEELDRVTGGTTFDKSSPLLDKSSPLLDIKFEADTQSFNFFKVEI